MKDDDYRELLNVLMKKRIELRRRTQAINADAARTLSADSGEQAIELENAEVLDELAREAIEELSKINMALARAESGRFGICVGCGEPVEPARLRAVPWTAYCIDCGNRNEQPKLR